MPGLVNPGGRPMTGALQRALDDVSREDRRIVVAALKASEGRLAALHKALAIELELAGLREQDTAVQFRQMMQDSIPDPPWPKASGPAMQYDPETGELS